ncbi:TPA: hypothetical protein ACHXFN_003288 [Escherichia coli]
MSILSEAWRAVSFRFLKSKTFCTWLIHTYHDNRRWFAAIVSYIRCGRILVQQLVQKPLTQQGLTV